MNSDFSQPQRQSLIGVVVMFTDTLQRTIRALFPLLIVILTQSQKIYLWPSIGVALLVIAVIAYLKYRNFTFQLDEKNEEFVVRHGIINKSRLAIPLEKIQQVNINQSFIQKIIGVHALEVDTAGSNKTEVSVKAISHKLALSLKARLLAGKSAPKAFEDDVVQETAESEHPFIQISFASLFKTGITSNYARSFALLIAFFITAFQYIEDVITYADIEDDPLDEYINAEVMLKFVFAIIIAIMILTLMVNLIRTVVRYYNFKITKQQESLLLSYGLINTKNTIIRPEKVQILTIGRNFFQKKLNILDLKIRQASGIFNENKKAYIEVPGCNEIEKNELLEFLMGQVPQRGEMIKPNYRKFVFNFFRAVLIPVAIYFTLAYFFADLLEYIVFVPAYATFATLLVYFGYRNSRLFVNNDYVVNQRGAWDIDNDYLAPHKIQAIALHQFFWQVPADVGAITLSTAGGEVSFGVANFTRLKELVNVWLYQIETSTKHWM